MRTRKKTLPEFSCPGPELGAQAVACELSLVILEEPRQVISVLRARLSYLWKEPGAVLPCRVEVEGGWAPGCLRLPGTLPCAEQA